MKQDFKENLFSIGMDPSPASGNGAAPFEMIGKQDHLSIVRIKQGNTPNDVLNYLLQQRINITSFNEILPSLSEIFIKLVEGTPTARQFQTINA